ncbi:MAG: PaaI family thioesterase, partial [Thermodesulfobacteriota bacterium]
MRELTLNPDYAEALRRVVNRCPYFTLLSMEIQELQWGTSLVGLDLREKHLQPFGRVHGGVIASVVDAAVFWAVFTEIEDGKGLTTAEVKLNYL